jgi:hypothetical protein
MSHADVPGGHVTELDRLRIVRRLGNLDFRFIRA